MIKKIQTRIIAVAFSSVLVILFTIVFSINLISYLNIEKKGDSILTVLLNNDGVFPDKHQPKTDLDQESLAEYQLDYSTLSQKNIEDDSTDETDDMYEETPFQTRFFTANLNPDGSVININNSHVAAFSTDEITNIVDSVFLDEQMTGYYGDYKFSSKIKDDSTYLYVFIDLHSELENFRYFRFCSITISCAGLGAFAIMTIAISYLAIRPAIEIEKKQKMFITNASHSFKTPLSIIQANNEVMESLNGNSQWSESISKQINKLTRQTNQLVYLSRLDEGNMPENKDNFSLSDLLKETLSSFTELFKKKNVEILTDIEPNIEIKADLQQFTELISIFLENATKYALNDHPLEVTLSKKGSIRMTFRNSIDYEYEGDPSLLFDRFYRTDDSRNSSNGGSGLGLSIAQAIVRSNKGKIKAEIKSKDYIYFEITF